MKGFLNSCIVALALVSVSSATYTGRPDAHNLANLFFRSRMSSRDPAVTMACFGDYMIQTNNVGEAYSEDYNQCLLDAKDGRKLIEQEMSVPRGVIVASSEAVCQSMKTCNGLNTTLALFTCHAEIGANNTKAVYSISGNASEHASVMHEKYRLIDLKHDQCCKLAERKYVEDSAQVYRVLQDCLEGRITPTTAAPSTTTAAPSTTTPVPSTTTTTTTTTTKAPTTTAPPTTSSTTTTTTAKPSTTAVPNVSPSAAPINPEVQPTNAPGVLENTQNFAAQLLKLFK